MMMEEAFLWSLFEHSVLAILVGLEALVDHLCQAVLGFRMAQVHHVVLALLVALVIHPCLEVP